MANKKTPKKKSNRQSIIIGVIALIIIVIGAYAVIRQPGSENTNSTNPTATPTATPTTSPANSNSTIGTKVLLQTTAGNITIQLRTDKPITTTNFINIVQKGWYDGTTFHRTMTGFMIQGGIINETVPTIHDEIGNNNRNVAYTIAMAKTNDPNSATSEFFINVADNGNNWIDQAHTTKFDQVYTEFGTVISGQSVVDSIANAPVTENPYNPGEMSVPVNPVSIITATIIP
jgi:cyclophilin family peptidyl-prolyl cis-trans isomerase